MADLNDPVAERIASEKRSRQRQKHNPPLLIRDPDGSLWPHTELTAKKTNLRPYYGDPRASLTDRQRYLKGLGARRQVSFTAAPEEPFDIGKASLEELQSFAQDQYGLVLDPSRPLKQLREQVYQRSQQQDDDAPPLDTMPAGAAPEGAVSAAQFAQGQAAQREQEAPTAVRETRSTRGSRSAGMALSE